MMSLCSSDAVVPELCGFQGSGLSNQGMPCKSNCRLQPHWPWCLSGQTMTLVYAGV